MSKPISDAAKTCFAKYADFEGQACRAEFWWFFLFVMIIYFLALFIVGGMSVAQMNPGADLVRGRFSGSVVVLALFWLFLFIPMLAVQIRRLHDTDRSGWWLGAFWLLYVLYMSLTFSMVFSATPGTAPNVGSVAAVGIFALIFFVYSIVLLVFWCVRGTNGANRFGDDPYGPDFEQVFA